MVRGGRGKGKKGTPHTACNSGIAGGSLAPDYSVGRAAAPHHHRGVRQTRVVTSRQPRREAQLPLSVQLHRATREAASEEALSPTHRPSHPLRATHPLHQNSAKHSQPPGRSCSGGGITHSYYPLWLSRRLCSGTGPPSWSASRTRTCPSAGGRWSWSTGACACLCVSLPTVAVCAINTGSRGHECLIAEHRCASFTYYCTPSPRTPTEWVAAGTGCPHQPPTTGTAYNLNMAVLTVCDSVPSLVNEGNIRTLTRELLDYLAVSDAEFKPDLTAKICMLIQR